ncbi:hypothetical protein CQA62_05775 [Helicobacter cholecystus]|uniref:Uncharacterized protein n=1 Tax=Helicobacter cholecystus TaxID=45498 RepID=A0A3D8ITU6_9HELI|nr:TonB C-terminal domain-containing protein [Helicobacter cholecystus]RDU68727.1 hypothetical protein CQA62_05775 [Helicobacter cholecystus]VEJ26212.1 cell envelope biogenesis protein TonB [Helicobacter cholecystus]
MNRRLIWSAFCAGFLELCVLLGLVFALLPKFQEKYTAKDKTQIEFIQIDELIAQAPQAKSKQSQPKKQPVPQTKPNPKPMTTKEEIKPKTSSPLSKSSPIVGTDVKKLFEKVDRDLSLVQEEEIIEDSRPTFSANSIQSKEYTYEKNNQDIQEETSKLKNVLEQIWEKELEVTSPSPQDMIEGKYDQWFAEVKKILYAKWNNHFYESVAIVVNISITDEGKFSYRIITYSKNASYNAYMEGLLQSLTKENFPPYPKGRRADIEVVFKTKEQNNE